MKRLILPICSILAAGCLFGSKKPVQDDDDNNLAINIGVPPNVAQNNVAPNNVAANNDCGVCEPLVGCEDGEVVTTPGSCEDGECVHLFTESESCEPSEACVDGRCEPNRCALIECAPTPARMCGADGQLIVFARIPCTAETPCGLRETQIPCEANEVCQDGECRLQLPEFCGDTEFTGQIAGPAPHHGGTYTNVPYTENANLELVWSSVAADPGVSDVMVSVSGATVTAIGFAPDFENAYFWVQDANRGMVLRLTNDADVPMPVDVDVRVGQTVSFTVEQVERFEGRPQIKAIKDFNVESEDGPVYVIEKFGDPIGLQDRGKLVRIGGTLGTPMPCGSNSQCFPMAENGRSTVLRSSWVDLKEGDCTVFVGPVSAYSETTGGTVVQLNTASYDWVLLSTNP